MSKLKRLSRVYDISPKVKVIEGADVTDGAHVQGLHGRYQGHSHAQPASRRLCIRARLSLFPGIYRSLHATQGKMNQQDS
jgi:hypothetical protein